MATNLSRASQLALLPEADREAFLAQCTPDELAALEYDWARFWARPNQLPPPGAWKVWLILSGRGWGKTRVGAEQVIAWSRTPNLRMALVAETAADVCDVVVEGESGILACSPPWWRPTYQPTKRRLSWPNGTIATTYSGDAPEQLRGPQHHHAWCDEIAKWRYAEEAWHNLELGLRLGTHPQIVATTTPRPIPLLRHLLADPGTVVTRGSTHENTINLAPSFKERILQRYEGTRLGRQELYAELLEDTPGALWTRLLLEQTRARTMPTLRRIVIGVDPGHDAGIVVAGVGADGQGYVLEDLSISGSPATWAQQAIAGYHKYRANVIVAESNHGGDMVISTITTQDAAVATKKVWASQGKYARAEPVSALYEKGLVHHVGMFAELEDQLCNWVPGEGLPSPDRLDALTWGLTELLLTGGQLPAVDLSRAFDLKHRSFLGSDQVAARRQRFAPEPPRTGNGSVEDWVRQRWGVADPYADEDY
jgi:phage terminase large subunit-like protein